MARLICCILIVGLLAGCGNHAAPQPRMPQGSVLPSLAQLDTLARATSAYVYQAGAERIASHGDVQPAAGEAVSLSADEGELAWALYRFKVESTAWTVRLDWTEPDGTAAWIAISDFAAGAWEMDRIVAPLDALPTFEGDRARFRSPAGYVYVAVLASDAAFQFERVRLEVPGPVLHWTRSMGYAGLDEYFSAVDVDELGNVFCSGQALDLQSDPPVNGILLAKYDIYGRLGWAKRIGSDTHIVATDCIADGAGGVVVAASYYGPWQPDKLPILVFRLDGAGQVSWANFYNTGGVDMPARLNWDTQGRLLLAGESDLSDGCALLARLNGDGSVQMARLWSAEGFAGVGTEVVGNDNVLYATAYRAAWHWLARFNPDGSPVWARQLTWPGSNARPPELELDNSNGVFLGASNGRNNPYVTQLAILHFDFTGSVLTQFGYELDGNSSRFGGLVLDDSGSLLFGVSSVLIDTEMGIVRLAPDGTLLNELRLAGEVSGDPELFTLATLTTHASDFYLVGTVEIEEPAVLASRIGTTFTPSFPPELKPIDSPAMTFTKTATTLTSTDFVPDPGQKSDADAYLVSGEF